MANDDRFVRIDRTQLVSDTNVKKAGSITTDITSPVLDGGKVKLPSRVGDSNRTPMPSYAIRFNSSNINSYIYTTIPSSKIDDYEYIVKGEGSVDPVKIVANTYNNTICIVIVQAVSNSTWYFDLSYVIFKNKTTGEIEHLFECEEGGGLYLYDAITGNKAWITYGTNGVNPRTASLSALRIPSDTKEWVKDLDCNLDNTVGMKNSVLLNTGATLPGLPLSICCDVTFTKEVLDDIELSKTTTSAFQYVLYMQGKGSGYSNRVAFMFLRYTGEVEVVRLMIRIFDASNNVSECLVRIDDPKTLLGRHTYVAVVRGLNDDKSVDGDIYIDGVQQTLITGGKNSTSDDVSGTSYTANNRNFTYFMSTGTSPVVAYTEYHRLDVFNFDMTMENSPFTVDAWQSIKQLPGELLSAQASNDDITMGSTTDGGWNVTETLTSTLTKGNWRCASSSLIKYAVSRTDDLPPDCESGYAIGLNGSDMRAYSANFLMLTPNSKWNKSSLYVHVKLKYRKDTAGTSATIYGGLQVGYYTNVFIQIMENSVAQGEWNVIDGLYKADSWNGDAGYFGFGARPVGESSLTTSAWSISDFQFKILTAVISLRNIDTTNNIWRDATSNNNDATVMLPQIDSYVVYPNKCYGTWLNGVGYGAGVTSENGLTTPRGVANSGGGVVFQLTKNSILTPVIYNQPDVDGLSVSFEDDGTMVFKTTKDFTLNSAWFMPTLRTNISQKIPKGAHIRVSYDYTERGDNIYLTTANYGKPGVVSLNYERGIPIDTINAMPTTAIIENYSYKYITTEEADSTQIYIGVQLQRVYDTDNLTIPADAVLFKLRNLKVEWLPDIPS